MIIFMLRMVCMCVCGGGHLTCFNLASFQNMRPLPQSPFSSQGTSDSFVPTPFLFSRPPFSGSSTQLTTMFIPFPGDSGI